MYKKIFNQEKQDEMRHFFLNELAILGKVKNLKKNEIFDVKGNDSLWIVVEGMLQQVLYHSKGEEKLMFFLSPGEICGEEEYFVSGGMPVIVKACCQTKVSLVEKKVLDEFLNTNPRAYRFFIHSFTRKYRISVSQMHDILFTTSKEKICSTLYRLSVQGGIETAEGKIIDIKLTHQELANLVGSSRITVTKIINELKNENIIERTKDKRFIIKDLDKLKKYLEY
ncbi:cyclic nucleotide-binding domain-containing protein [Clostridium sporogenes]|uniref:Crp/Fnr family transcriptional regulator n=1 Tax=Clostridium botulinum TaxID=1491 RepID=UPI000717A77F|nr:Crp/Fnr family transcriptional regulator [Clostridium botulinum]KRU24727.1 cyclic nucleotide-binding domain-containing protein [Clostridium sporogenes]KRU26472.1 cyclic nucleotide-binding domain-containing protein [Clostridium sporogenes]KRU35668.1 cyclic nucleotide-binding domain-containing protein [Clostridium sporogenes]KRU40734.1 cyclic nucleotide-binding domain-containing protein [Clostridium sporogenes]MBZ1329617.1 Crp/Fnr family transcriptional regulator [Clostridium botulinum]